MIKALRTVALLLALAWAGLAFVMVLFQPGFIYYPDMPSRTLVMTPDKLGMAFEDVTIETGDGVRLHGWFVPAHPARGTVLFFHGNAGNISHRMDTLDIFQRLGLNTLLIDYRGYGKSEGEPSEAGTYQDAMAAWHWLTEQKRIPDSDIILFGRSLGGAVAANLASRVQARGLVIESGFTSIADRGAELYPYMPVRWMSRIHYDTASLLPDIRTPVLIIHSPDDEIIPYHHGEQLYALARQYGQMLTIRGGHNDGFLQSGGQYLQGLDDFIRRTEK